MSEDVFDRALDRRDAVIEEQRRRIKALEEEVARLKELALPPPAPATTPGPWRADQ